MDGIHGNEPWARLQVSDIQVEVGFSNGSDEKENVYCHGPVSKIKGGVWHSFGTISQSLLEVLHVDVAPYMNLRLDVVECTTEGYFMSMPGSFHI